MRVWNLTTLERFATISEVLWPRSRSEEYTSELQSRGHLVCRLLLEKKRYLKIEGDVQRAPELFIRAVLDGEAVGIVHRGQEIIDLGRVVSSEEDDASHRCERDMTEL